MQITVGLWTWGGHSTEMTTENPLWVGAWWIGFLAGGAAALLTAFPILGYPRQLPGNCTVTFKKTLTIIPISVIVVMKTLVCLCLFLAGSQEFAATRVSEAHQLKDGSHTTASDPQFGRSVKDMPK